MLPGMRLNQKEQKIVKLYKKGMKDAIRIIRKLGLPETQASMDRVAQALAKARELNVLSTEE